MTVADLIKQAEALSHDERNELIQQLQILQQAMLTTTKVHEDHWGKKVGIMLDDIIPVEMKYIEIDDPVDWLERLRDEQRSKRNHSEEDV